MVTVACAAAVLALWSALFVEIATSGRRVGPVTARLGSAVVHLQEAARADAGPATSPAGEAEAPTSEAAWSEGFSAP
jgi:hypothetical protein